jgi:hypothetical protein
MAGLVLIVKPSEVLKYVENERESADDAVELSPAAALDLTQNCDQGAFRRWKTALD